MSNQFESLDYDDIISVKSQQTIVLPHPTFKVTELIAEIGRKLGIGDEQKKKWFCEGVDAEVLIVGAKGWQTGKIRLTIEFYSEQPSQPPSPLDDLRQQIKETED